MRLTGPLIGDQTQARQMFSDLGADRALPKSLLGGSKLSREAA